MDRLGIDIGATKINFVLFKSLPAGRQGKKIIKSWKILTPKTRIKLTETLKKNIPPRVKSIGIGVPGPLNKKGDLILNPPNLRCLWNCSLAKIIEKDLKIKTKMDNDANCFTLGEALLGAGRGAKIVFGITLGTGVGGGLVMDGKIYRGAFGSAGEVGHMAIKFDGLKCGCGNRGCLEAYCSKKIRLDFGEKLGIGLANVINLLDPEVIVIGGGVGINRYQSFIKEAKKEIKKRVISPLSQKNVKIKKAALGELGGAIGAALLNYYG